MPFLADYPIRSPLPASDSPASRPDSAPAASSAAAPAGPIPQFPTVTQPGRAGSFCHPRWLDYELCRMLARAEKMNAGDRA